MAKQERPGYQSRQGLFGQEGGKRRMIGTLRIEGQNIYLDGYPEGSSLVQFGLAQGNEMRRMYLYGIDLRDCVSWLGSIEKGCVGGDLREPLAIAALVRFCRCFENTKNPDGLRRKPLSQKRIFSPDERESFKELRNIRDKIIVHDEQLYPNHFPWLVVSREGEALEAGVLGATFGLTNFESLGGNIAARPQGTELGRYGVRAAGF